jgi:uncharacterized glyoxalase superfamily protein PhnB
MPESPSSTTPEHVTNTDNTSAGTAFAATMVWPSFRYADAPAAIEFLTSALGFVATAVYTSQTDPGIVEHAELRWPLGGGIMLGSVRESADGPPRPGHNACYVVTDDPDGLFARVTAAGATIDRELSDTDYGSREFAIRDPEGNLWSFGTYAGE